MIPKHQLNKDNLIVKGHSFFLDKYNKKLKEPICVIQSLTTLCGGWYLQTFKQVTNKLSKNKSSPLPLFFPNIDAMDCISKNRQLLKQIFKSFDTRSLGRIDACQLYSILLILSKGSYQIYLKTIVDIFGFELIGRINRNEFFFFLDSLYRALPKVLIVKNCQIPFDINARLQFKDINKFINTIFEQKQDLQRNQIYQAMMRQPQLNDFLKYLHKKCMTSAQHSRNKAINKINIQTQVRRILKQMVSEIEKELQVPVKILDDYQQQQQ